MSDQHIGKRRVVLAFALDVKDGWPPVAAENVPCTPVDDGYRIEVAPLFVKDISRGDVISVIFDEERRVQAWKHESRSDRTTIWLLRIGKEDGIVSVLEDIRSLGCNTVQLAEYGCYSIDVPGNCPIKSVDECLARLDERDVAIAHPSFRHS